VTVTDTTSGQTFVLGAISCYTNSTKTAPASYPNAAYCVSSSSSQTVATSVQNTTFSDNFVIDWSFPLAATNPYEGSGATITLDATFTGATAGGARGASTTGGQHGGLLGASTTGGQHGGVLGASSPVTGAQLPIVLSCVLIVLGLGLVFSGLWVWRRQRSFGQG
jgi:hypothetical protein